jgi:hypothetical protein
MRSPTARAALGVAVIVVAVALLIVLSDGEDSGTSGRANGDTSDKTRTGPGDSEPNGKVSKPIPVIVIRDGEPVGGVAELSFEAGEQIRFRVRSDAADEIHIHGYGVEKEVPAGGTIAVSFPADIEGIFEVELHDSEEQIAELRVNP